MRPWPSRSVAPQETTEKPARAKSIAAARPAKPGADDEDVAVFGNVLRAETAIALSWHACFLAVQTTARTRGVRSRFGVRTSAGEARPIEAQRDEQADPGPPRGGVLRSPLHRVGRRGGAARALRGDRARLSPHVSPGSAWRCSSTGSTERWRAPRASPKRRRRSTAPSSIWSSISSTYVLVPVVALWRSDLMPTPVAFWMGLLVIIASALYFADTRMKTQRLLVSRLSRVVERVRRSICSCCACLGRVNAALTLLATAVMFAPVVFVHPLRVRETAAADDRGDVRVVRARLRRDFRRICSRRLGSKVGFVAIAVYFLALPLLRHSPWSHDEPSGSASAKSRLAVRALETCYSRLAAACEIRFGTASWRSGYAEDCKSLHPGSIPGEASITFDSSGRRRRRHGSRRERGDANGCDFFDASIDRAAPPYGQRTVARPATSPI